MMRDADGYWLPRIDLDDGTVYQALGRLERGTPTEPGVYIVMNRHWLFGRHDIHLVGLVDLMDGFGMRLADTGEALAGLHPERLGEARWAQARCFRATGAAAAERGVML